MLIGFVGLKAQIFTTNNATLSFVSDAPLEVIKATSAELQGALEIEKKTFAFKVYMKSFNGFNSPLQKEHFFENYMEVNRYPLAVFKGKIIEEFVKSQKKYRAKGMLNLHGVTKEVIIDVWLTISENNVDFDSKFKVSLADFEIELPMIVHQKIAEVIDLQAKGKMDLRK